MIQEFMLMLYNLSVTYFMQKKFSKAKESLNLILWL